MKKAVFFLVVIFFVPFAYSKTNNRFYASIEDYYNDKFIEGVEVIANSWFRGLGNESIRIKEKDKAKRVKVFNLPSRLFTYNNMLIKVDRSFCYYVLVVGPVCYYTSVYSSEVYENDPGSPNKFRVNRTYHHNANGNTTSSIIKNYYSESINGEIRVLSNKTLERLLMEYNLSESYNEGKPRKERGTLISGYYEKRVNRIATFIELVNEKRTIENKDK